MAKLGAPLVGLFLVVQGARIRETSPWRHADLCEDIEDQIRTKETTTLGGIPAEEDHKAPGKSLAGDNSGRHGKTLAGPPGKALAKRVSRATVRPAPAKSPPPFACSCRPNQLGRHLRGDI